MPHDAGTSASPGSSEPPRPRYFTLTVRTLLCGLFAIVWLVVWSVAAANSVYLYVRGQEATATVASVDGRRATVHLPPPVDRTVELREWFGPPHVGDIVRLRYDPADPDDNQQAGNGHWLTLMVFAVPIAAGAFHSWWAGTEPRRRAR